MVFRFNDPKSIGGASFLSVNLLQCIGNKR